MLGAIFATSTVYIVAIFMLLIGSLWVVEGRPMMEYHKLIKGVPWESWWLTAVVMCLGTSLTGADTGVTAFYPGILKPLLGGLSPFLFLVVVYFAAWVMTNVCNNVVVICMMPILLAMAPVIGFEFNVGFFMVMLSSHFAMLTPAASGPTGLIFSNKEWVSLKGIYTHGLVLLTI